MSVDIVQPTSAIQKLVHPLAGWQFLVRETKRTVLSGGKNATIHERIVID